MATGRGRGSRTFADAGATLGLLGVAAVTAQASIDLLVGYASVDRDTMNVLFDHIRDLPGVTPAVYTIGPLLFYVGLLLLTVQLAALRAIVFWRPLAIVAGVAVSAISLDLIPVGGLLFLLALAPLGGNVPTQPSSPASPAESPARYARPTPCGPRRPGPPRPDRRHVTGLQETQASLAGCSRQRRGHLGRVRTAAHE